MRCCSEEPHAAARPLLALAIAMALIASFQGACLAADGSPTNTPEPPAFHASLPVALEAARTDLGTVLAVFTQDSSPECRALADALHALPNPPLQSTRLHIVEIDPFRNPAEASRWRVRTVPALVLLDADGTLLARRDGAPAPGELQGWIQRGIERLQHGTWEGVAVPPELEGIWAKARARRLEAADLQQLGDWLGDADPAKRAAAVSLLTGLRDAAVPILLDAMAHPYLGIRISAAEALEKLAPELPPPDPWKSPPDEAPAIAAWRDGWARSGALAAAAPPARPTPDDVRTLDAALADLRGQDPLRQTEAKTALVRRGPEALPPVREALAQAERAGNPRLSSLLEDVRWALLVPDTLEHRAGPIRRVLARGKGPDRQAAVARLAKAGAEGMRALSELLGDPDSLVAEAAVRALSRMGTKDIIPAMASLLKASDSNLRMSAARALGHLKEPAATAALLEVINDPHEVVACTALAAVEEAHARSDTPRKASPPELLEPLRRALADPRWRVRAAAAEVAGKLRIQGLQAALQGLLQDSDPFAAKTAFEALQAMAAPPEIPELAALARTQPGLRPQILALFASSRSPEAAPALLDLYASTPGPGRQELLRQLAPKKSAFQDEDWGLGTNCTPVLLLAAADPDPQVRREAALLLPAAAFASITNLAGSLLADADAATRSAAAKAALVAIRAADSAALQTRSGQVDADRLLGDARPDGEGSRMLHEPVLRSWHATLERDPSLGKEFPVTLACYLTGPAEAPTSQLANSILALDAPALQEAVESGWVDMLMTRLAWPGGEAVLAALETRPLLYARALTAVPPPRADVQARLFDPERLRHALGPVSQEEAPPVVQVLLNRENAYTRPRMLPEPALAALAPSTNPTWRAFSIYGQAQNQPGTNLAVFIEALASTNDWVRIAGVQALALHSSGRDQLETWLGPLLLHSNREVAMIAAVGLLEPEVRQSAGLQARLLRFNFPGVADEAIELSTSNTEGPLAPLKQQPAFLDAIQANLRTPATEDTCLQALLLAQYGRREGIDHCIAQATAGLGLDAILTAIALTPEARYLGFVRDRADQTHDPLELLRLLRTVNRMTGTEVRQLRLEINRRLRG
jgi:HEAT repeat protein